MTLQPERVRDMFDRISPSYDRMNLLMSMGRDGRWRRLGVRASGAQPGDAALDVVGDVLAGGKNSRLYKRLVYDLQIAQSVAAGQNSQALSSYFIVQATPRPGHTGRGFFSPATKFVLTAPRGRLRAGTSTCRCRPHCIQRGFSQG